MSANSNYNKKEQIIIYFLASIVGIVVTILSMLLASFLAIFLDISSNLLYAIASICFAVGSFFAGLICSKKIGSRGILNGIIIALIMFFLIKLIAIIFGPSAFTINSLFHFIVGVLSSLIGGIIGVNIYAKIV